MDFILSLLVAGLIGLSCQQAVFWLCRALLWEVSLETSAMISLPVSLLVSIPLVLLALERWPSAELR